MKIECHILQNFAPSCLNRDDTNTPKECEFGGVRRARISSQSFKRAIREHFRATNSVSVGERTKALKGVLADKVQGADPKAIETVLAALAKMDTKRGEESSVLIFVGPEEIDALVQCVRERITDKKEVEKRVRAARTSADVALFGRMLAEAPDVNIDAACQVGHALSTHATELEMDFFTAVDDLNPRDDVGAGMLGYVGYSSACLYRYALLDTVQLKKNLNGDAAMAKQAVEAFLWAFCDAEPSARQNSMPAHNRPSLGLFIARTSGVPTSLANAFCKPVATRGNNPDLIGKSIVELAKFHACMDAVYEAFSDSTQSLYLGITPDQLEALIKAEADKKKGSTTEVRSDQSAKEPTALDKLLTHDKGSQKAAIEAILASLEG
jgi:CRISPR system Cascade subunit CasC